MSSLSSKVKVLTREAAMAKEAEGGLTSSPEPPGDVDIGKLAGTSKVKKGVMRRPVAVLKGLEADRVAKAPLGEVRVSALPQEVRASPSAYSLAERIEQAKQSGYDEGYQKGFDDALLSIEAGRLEAVRKLAEVLGNTASVLAESRYEVMAASSREVVDLACLVAEAILLRELAVSKNPGREALERALSIVPEGSDLVVHMNPSDVAEIGDLSKLTGAGNLDGDILDEGISERGLLDRGNLDIISDSSVEKGGCVLQAGSCRIDAQWSVALQRVTDLLCLSLPGTNVSLDQLEDGER